MGWRKDEEEVGWCWNRNANVLFYFWSWSLWLSGIKTRQMVANTCSFKFIFGLYRTVGGIDYMWMEFLSVLEHNVTWTAPKLLT